MNALTRIFNMARRPASPVPPPTEAPAGGPALSVSAPAPTAAPPVSAVPSALREAPLPPQPPAPAPRLFEHLGFLDIPPRLVLAVAKRAEHPLVTADEQAALCRLQREYDEATAFLEKHSDREAVRQYKAQLKDTPNRPLAELSGTDHWTKIDFEDDFRQKRSLGKQRLRAITAQARPIAQAVSTRLSQVALTAFKEQEAKERLDAESFGLEYRPSLLTATLGQLSWRVLDQADTGGSYYPPAKMLLFAGIAL